MPLAYDQRAAGASEQRGARKRRRARARWRLKRRARLDLRARAVGEGERGRLDHAACARRVSRARATGDGSERATEKRASRRRARAPTARSKCALVASSCARAHWAERRAAGPTTPRVLAVSLAREQRAVRVSERRTRARDAGARAIGGGVERTCERTRRENEQAPRPGRESNPADGTTRVNKDNRAHNESKRGKQTAHAVGLR